MQWAVLVIAVALSIVFSLLLSMVFHGFIFLALLPFLFVPFVLRSSRVY